MPVSSSPTNSDGVKMPAKLRSLYQSQKPTIEISLNSKQKTYTTMDRLEGIVSITAPTDVSFDDIDIEFVGTSRTYVERTQSSVAAASGRSEAFHQFLKLQQPQLQQRYPQHRIFKADQTYDFPFLFVIPQQLLPKICQHKTVSPSVRDAHLQLPPSFGDRETAKADSIDDMVPDMASIRYGIFARITKDKEQSDEIIKTTIASRARRLRVMPATTEQPPLAVGAGDDEYRMRKEKTIKKGVLKGKLGTLIMEAAQPPSLRMRARSTVDSEASAMATIMLRFEPVDKRLAPPRLGGLSSKLKVCTFFASTARSSFPKKSMSGIDLSQGFHSEQVSLSSRCMENAEWTKHEPAHPGPAERRDSALSIPTIENNAHPEPSAAFKGDVYYTARLLVPITLPKNKTFVPTFHSCLISRVYLLKLELGLQNVGIGSGLELRIPFQISREAADSDSQRHGSVDSSMETEVDEEETSEFFEPRTIRSISGEYVGRSRIGSQAPVDDGPPGYSFLAPRA